MSICLEQAVIEGDYATVYEALRFAALELKNYKIINFYPFSRNGVQTQLFSCGKDRTFLNVIHTENSTLSEIVEGCRLEVGL